jgi:hypothetical protein
MSGIKGQPKFGAHVVCCAEGCSSPAKYKGMGLCSAHRNRLARQTNFDAKVQPREPATGVCNVKNCGANVFAKKLCKNCYSQNYAKKNPQKICAMASKRRASIRNRAPSWLTTDDFWLIEEAYSLAQMRTKLFGFKWHVDHILPLHGKKVSGLHVPINLQVIPATVNQRKSASFII